MLGYILRGWTDGAPGAAKYPRGGEKPINEFFGAVGPGQRGAAAQSGHDSGAEALDLAEQLLNRIDRKIDMLRDLIKQADQRIETLGQSYQLRPPDVARVESAAAAPEPETWTRPRAGGAVRQEPETATDDRRARIIKLHRKGLTSSQIAREIGMGRGEVDLILSIDEMG
jgi:hypothetical protein